MKKLLKKIFLFSLISVSVFYASFFVFSYGDKITHPALTEQAVKLHNDNAIEKISSKEMEWIKKGSAEEDINPRYINHFYDPIYKTALKDGLVGDIAKTSIAWAHSSVSQSTPAIGRGDYTWESAIYYYQNGDKEKAYIALGHILHLLEDMAVPAHTRDDGHGIAEEPYETWVDNYIKDNKINFSNVSSVNCEGLDQCFSNLAYYTNTNFFSKDTINSDKYKLPEISKSEVKKIFDGRKFEFHYNSQGQLVALSDYIEANWYNMIKNDKKAYLIDDSIIHQSYFNNLAPKAVSYGAGIIKLFYEEAGKEKNVEPLTWWDSKKIAIADTVNSVKDTTASAYNSVKNTITDTGAKIVSAFIGQAGQLTANQESNKTPPKADQLLAETNQGNNLTALSDISAQAGKAESVENITSLLNDIVKNSAGNFKKSVGKVLGEAAVATKQESKENNLTPTLSLKEREINLTLPLSSKEREYNAEIVKVKYVIDGDTIELEDGRKVRYIGMDTPELNNAGSDDDECLSWAARERNRYLLENAKEINLISDNGVDKDTYGRLLRYVYANTLFVNKILVNEGLAEVFICESYMKNCPLMLDDTRIREIHNAGQEAKNKKRGIYSEICAHPLPLSRGESENSSKSGVKSEGDTLAGEPSSANNGSNNKPTQSPPFILATGVAESKNNQNDEKNSDDEENKNSDDDSADEGIGKKIIAADNIPPISNLKDLAEVNSTDFMIKWGGEDYGDIISGIAFYDLMYNKINELWQWGDWESLETATSATSTIFTIKDQLLDGKTLCFRIRATDKAGNIEEWPITSPPPSPEGEGENISEQIKCSKINLTFPKTPFINYPTNNFIFNSDIAAFSVSGTADAADVGKKAVVEIKPALLNIYKAGEIIIDENGNWEIENIFIQTGVSEISAYVVEVDGDESERAKITIEKTNKPDLTVVINEIAWMGTESSTADEWIELYNNTGFNLDLTGWTLNATDGTPQISLTGNIAPYGFYLLERTDDTTINTIVADQFFTGDLENGGEYLTLRDNGNLIDHINCSDKWFGKGDNSSKKTMERIDPTKSGDDSANWGTNDTIFKNGFDAGGNAINGTPKSINSATVSAGIIPHQLTVLNGSIVNENIILTKMGSPYLLEIMIFMEGANLNIEAGTIIKMATNGMLATYKGTLNIRGTKKWPVILTSEKDDMYGGDTNNDSNATSPKAGDWKAFMISSLNTATILEIDNMILKFGALGVYGDVKINNSEISGGSFADEMVLIEGGEVEIHNSFIGGNSEGQKIFNGIVIKAADSVNITDTIFENNLGYGVVNNSKNAVNARNNWWGDATGPHNAISNPLGIGVEVSDNVEFDGWKLEL